MNRDPFDTMVSRLQRNGLAGKPQPIRGVFSPKLNRELTIRDANLPAVTLKDLHSPSQDYDGTPITPMLIFSQGENVSIVVMPSGTLAMANRDYQIEIEDVKEGVDFDFV